MDTDRFLAALLMQRNTPSAGTNMSPSEVVFGRKIKDLIPIVQEKLKFEPSVARFVEAAGTSPGQASHEERCGVV